ncbi:hypothetical protein GCM10018787_18400 [Streptomyces thermodiastaticus]|nr:hypothetical protein GCM10018787_18400 [Streptomyces thermodiastaticus]
MLLTYQYKDIAVTFSSAASRRMENLAIPSASSNRTLASVIRSRSSPEGCPPRALRRVLPSSHTLVRAAPLTPAGFPMVHLSQLRDGGHAKGLVAGTVPTASSCPSVPARTGTQRCREGVVPEAGSRGQVRVTGDG